MKSSKFLLLITLVFTILFFSIMMISSKPPSYSDFDVKSYVEDLNVALNKAIYEDPELASSSNPYDYRALEAYKNLVRIGPIGIPSMLKIIENSETNGLSTYLVAVAIEEISLTDIKGKQYSWDTGKNFVQSWKTYLEQIPNSVEIILSSDISLDEKAAHLTSLGKPAIPILAEKASTKKELEDILKKITKNLIPNLVYEHDLESWKNQKEISILYEIY